MYLCRGFTILLLLMTLFAGQVDAGESFDHSLLTRFYQAFVNEEGNLDFAAAKDGAADLDAYLERIAAIDFIRFDRDWPREEKLALWLNAYHAGLIRMLLDHYPLASINDIPAVWANRFIQIGMRSFSLNEIRQERLMESFRDEKIHLALACSALSCPGFPREAFTGPRVEGQLYIKTREVVNDSGFVKVESARKKLVLTRIFKWYGNDFILDFGSPAGHTDFRFSEQEMAVLSFIAHYLDDADKLEFLENADFKIRYMPFDWTLRDAAGSGQ